MMGHASCGCGTFTLGMMAGLAAGTVLGMAVAPSRRQIRRTAHMAAKRVNQAVDRLADAMDM